LPFREIKPILKFIRITSNHITISSFLIKKYFLNQDKLFNVKIFIDEKNKLVGFKPTSEDGYKISSISRAFRVTCAELQRKLNGTFYPIWSPKHQMLIFSYKKKP